MVASAAWTFGITAVVVWAGTHLFRRWAPRFGLLDIPNLRSSHASPVPRGGGIVFVASVPVAAYVAMLASNVEAPRAFWALWVSAWFLGAVSFVDDLRRLSPRVRLVAQAWAAGALIAFGGYLTGLNSDSFTWVQWGGFGIPLTFLWLVGVANAYNFMDGIDGLAAGQAFVIAIAAAVMALLAQLDWMAVFTAGLAGAMLGFLLHNRPPARVFMGDSGSIWLGFTFAGLSILGAQSGGSRISFGFWALLLSVFLIDTGLTLTRRVLAREPVLEAHRSHYYQRLLRTGWNHAGVLLVYLAIAGAVAGVAVVHFGLRRLALPILILATVGAAGAVLALVRHVEARREAVATTPKRTPLRRMTFGGMWAPVGRFFRQGGILLITDVFVVAAAYFLALLLRFYRNTAILPPYLLGFRNGILGIIFVHVTLNGAFRLYNRFWRYAGAADILATIGATAASALTLAGVELLLGPVRAIPLSVIAAGAMLAWIGMAAFRFRRQLWDEALRQLRTRQAVEADLARRILIVGANAAGQQLARLMQTSIDDRKQRLVGFIDADPHNVGRQLRDLHVLSGLDGVSGVVSRYGVTQVLIAADCLTEADIRSVQATCARLHVDARVIPNLREALGLD